MNILSWISGIFKPATDLIDNLHTSTEEKLKLHNELAKIQSSMHEKSIELMKAEASSENLLTSGWRPLCAIVIVIALILDGHFGYTASPNIYSLAEVFLGAYTGGRSLEKVAQVVKTIAKK